LQISSRRWPYSWENFIQASWDNLIAVYDRELATAFAIEAIRLVDHYNFRAVLSKATKVKPLRLKGPKGKWWLSYYNENSMKFRERLLLVR
jgi:hypothetical protein